MDETARITTEIHETLRTLRDDRSDANKCVEFLYRLTRQPADVPIPLLEIVAVIKSEKPILFSFVKPRVQHTPRLRLLFELSLDYTQASQRLDEYLGSPRL